MAVVGHIMISDLLKAIVVTKTSSLQLTVYNMSVCLLSRYYRLDKSKSLVDNLCHKTVVEFPVLHVVMKDQCSAYGLCDSEYGVSCMCR